MNGELREAVSDAIITRWFAIMFFTPAAATFNHHRFNAAISCFHQPAGIRLIADDNSNLSIRNPAVAYGIDKSDHVGAPT